MMMNNQDVINFFSIRIRRLGGVVVNYGISAQNAAIGSQHNFGIALGKNQSHQAIISSYQAEMRRLQLNPMGQTEVLDILKQSMPGALPGHFATEKDEIERFQRSPQMYFAHNQW